MNLVDNDGESPVSIISSLINKKAHRWDSTELCVKPEGNWLIFYDRRNREEINTHRLSKRRVGKPASYQLRGYRPTEPSPPENPLIHPPLDNYTDFRARHRIYGQSPRPHSQRVIPESLITSPGDQSTRYFRGDNPKRNPFRVSTKIINDFRMQEAKLAKPTVRPPASARSVRSNYMDLYEKSLKPKKKTVWPPDNYFDETGNGNEGESKE